MHAIFRKLINFIKRHIKKPRPSKTFPGIRAGQRFEIRNPQYIACPHNITAGDDVFINDGVTILAYDKIIIGSRTMFGPSVKLLTSGHDLSVCDGLDSRRAIISSPIDIGSDCWIGCGATILGGVTIGDRTIIGAGAVVTKTIPPDSIAAGMPAKIIRKRDYKDTEVNRNSDLTIAIPSLRFNDTIDETINSVLNLKHAIPEIIVNINSPDADYTKSNYWDHPRVKWMRNSETLPPHASYNSAAMRAMTKWVYVVSDDDILCENFLYDVDLSKAAADEIFVIPIDTINEQGLSLGNTQRTDPTTKVKSEIMFENYFTGKVWHNLSLLLFSKQIFDEIKGFPFTGFPNAYYVDNVFHARAFAKASNIHLLRGVQFIRRISTTQASAKFYWKGTELRKYFQIMISEMEKEPLLCEEISKRYVSAGAYLEELMLERLSIDLNKIQHFYPQLNSKRFKLYSSIMGWDLSASALMRGFQIIIRNELSRISFRFR